MEIFNIHGTVRIDIAQANNSINQLNNNVRRIPKELQQGVGDANSNISKMFSGLGGMLNGLKSQLLQLGAIYAGITVAKDSFLGGLKYDMTIESATNSFVALTGSMENAKAVMQDLQTFAFRTPFDIEGTIAGAKMLLGYGIQAKDLQNTMMVLGDISGGVTEKLIDLSRAFGQTIGKGKLMAQEANQMIDAGFPILAQIAAKTGETVAEVYHRMEFGIIGTKEVIQAMNDAVNENDKTLGRWAGNMERQGRSFLGLGLSVKDYYSMTIGQALKPLFNWIEGSGMPVLLSWFLKTSEWLKKHEETLREMWGNILLFVSEAMFKVKDFFVEFANSEKMLNFADKLVNYIGVVFTALVKIVEVGMSALSGTLTGDDIITLLDALFLKIGKVIGVSGYNAIQNFVYTQANVVGTLFEALKTLFEVGWNILKDNVSNIGDNIVIAFKNVKNMADEAIRKYLWLEEDVKEVRLDYVTPKVLVTDRLKKGWEDFKTSTFDMLSSITNSYENRWKPYEDDLIKTNKDGGSNKKKIEDLISGALKDAEGLIPKLSTKPLDVSMGTDSSSNREGTDGVSNATKLKELADTTEKIKDGITRNLQDVLDIAVKTGSEVNNTLMNALENTSNSIISALTAKYDEEYRLAKEASDKQLELIDINESGELQSIQNIMNAKLKSISDEENAQTKLIQSKIDNIQKIEKIEQYNNARQEKFVEQSRLKEELKELQSYKVGGAYRLKRSFTEDELSKIKDVKQKLEDIQSEISETSTKYKQDKLIEGYNEQIDKIKDLAEQKRKQAEQEAKNNENVTKVAYNILRSAEEDKIKLAKSTFEKLNSEEQKQAEARRMIIENNNEEIIKLLEKYNPSWENAGKTFGQRFLDGFNSTKSNIKQSILDIANLIGDNVTKQNDIILKAQSMYNDAKGRNDIKGMDEAHRVAEEARKNGGTIPNNISLYVTGNNISGDMDADRLGSILVNRLKALGV